MRLLTFEDAGSGRLGAAVGDDVVDLNRAYQAALVSRAAANAANGANAAERANAELPGAGRQFLALGPDAIAAAEAALEHVASVAPETARAQGLLRRRTELTLLPPIPDPPKVICVGRNFAEHAKEAGLPVSEIPIIFARFAATLVGHEAPVVRPRISEQLDWEGELAVVIGRGGRHIARAEALEHVAGYSVFNDVTVRDFQFRTTQYTAGKNFASSGPFGPELVLADEVADPHSLEIVTEIDGEVVQRGNTRDLIFDVPYIVAHLSEFIALEPGDVIPMGTPSGVGFKRTPPRFLAPGQVVRVSVEGVGTLENPVVEEAA